VALVVYPPGMSRIILSATLSSAGRPRTGRYRVEVERQFGYIGTGWYMTRFSEWFRLIEGRLELDLPHSDQPGLIGDNGAALTKPVAYKIQVKPNGSDPIVTEAWNTLPMALGAAATLDVMKPNLGGWPNSIVVTTPPPTDPTVPGTPDQYVETYPGSRIFEKV
jgi:hypothetical protein